MRLAFAGDTHGKLKFMYQTAEAWQTATGKKIDYLFQIGDLGFWSTYENMDPSARSYGERHGMTPEENLGDYPSLMLGKWDIPIPTYFIRGNHEDQPLLCSYEKALASQYPHRYQERSVPILPNLHYIPDGHVIDIQGIKIAGWGGCWSWKTFPLGYWSAQRHHLHSNKKKYGNRPWPKRLEHMTRDRGEQLLEEEFDILLTHDAPTGCGVIGSSSRFIDAETKSEASDEGTGVRQIRELIETSKCQHSFSGHWHQYRELQISNSTHVCLDQLHPTHPTENSFRVLEI